MRAPPLLLLTEKGGVCLFEKSRYRPLEKHPTLERQNVPKGPTRLRKPATKPKKLLPNKPPVEAFVIPTGGVPSHRWTRYTI